ncbi:GNAT family N-acetyltransferase [Phyllobacterium sophorae]|uniref:GNAT family N-acetyltransferase n=1 Tax=Phyllobacterium sophorae TaxID=1520277 RepID=A0A2P7BFJ9_9HYPH|nr:GNAT family N-acetyltransferase [Phyllobacterium sophorae]PSH65199.1 GNAT family N-acetyltransferase [Phyllobacterium sophorae]
MNISVVREPSDPGGISSAPKNELIRVAGDRDAPALLELLLTAYEPLREMQIRFSATTADIELVQRTIRRHTTFVIERHGTIIGTVSVRFPWPMGETHLTSYPFIHWFAVAPTFKRQAVGTTLLDHVELNFLRDQIKAPAVYLATATRHPWLVGLYERRGYEGFHKQVNRGDEVLYLRKILNPEIYDDLEVREHKHFGIHTPTALQA